MHAAILYDLVGDVPDDEDLVEKLDGEFPAVDVEGTHYLDGQTLYHGEAAARIHEERDLPMPTNGGIAVEPLEASRRVLVDFYADLQEGWAGVSSGDGEWFVDEYLYNKHRLDAYEMYVGMESWIQDFVDEDTATVWGLTYSVESGDETTRAGAQFHRDASIEQIERDAEDISGVGFGYSWGNNPIRGVIYESGYVAVYSQSVSESMFARYLSDHVLPYTVSSADRTLHTEQSTLGETDDETAEEGSEA
jgi:hypothetical protein